MMRAHRGKLTFGAKSAAIETAKRKFVSRLCFYRGVRHFNLL
jgi:hypothetical protein